MTPSIVSPIDRVGRDLARPECVLACSDGSFCVSDRRGLATHIAPDGAQRLLGSAGGMPNGIALLRDGSLAVADMALPRVHRLRPDGSEDAPIEAQGAEPLGCVNFVLADPDGSLWITTSTQQPTARHAIEMPTPDGRILRWRDGVLRTVADGLWFANEMRIDPTGRWVVVVETTRGRVSRAPLHEDGSLGAFTPCGPDPLYPGAYPDGLAFDQAGNLWITELSRNALLVLRPDGSLVTLIEDPGGERLNKPTSLAFHGADLRSVAVGSLKAKHLAVFRTDVPGVPLAHWNAHPALPQTATGVIR